MKLNLVLLQFICVSMLLLTGWPFQVLCIDTDYSAQAMSHRPHYYGNNGSGNNYQVPEPSTLVLLGTGIGGAGILCAFVRRNRKK